VKCAHDELLHLDDKCGTDLGFFFNFAVNSVTFVQNLAGMWSNNKLFCYGICHCELLEIKSRSSVIEM